MKTPYIYIGSKGYWNTPGVAPTSHVAAAATMSIASAGMLPAEDAKDSAVATSAQGYRVLVRCGAAATDTRGTDYTTDFVNGKLFAGGTAAGWGADLNVDDSQVGQVTHLTDADAYIAGDANGIITIGSNSATAGTVGADATNGITMTTDDTIVVEQYKRHDTVGNGAAAGELSSGYAYPMTGFLGANPVAYGKTHYDGTVLDRTDLHFLSTDGTGTNDIIAVIHTAGKYPDLVKTMEAIANCGVYNRAITFYDLDINGREYFAGGPSLSSQNDLGIVGIWRTTV